MEIAIEFLYLNLIVGTFLPVLIGIITKSSASRKVKTFVNALLSAVGGALVPILQSCSDVCVFEVQVVIVAVGATWIASIATYYGFWKPSGADDVIHEKTQNLGIG